MIPPKLPEETQRQYDAFLSYCKLGRKRSLDKTAEKCSRNASLLRRWSKKNNWQQRVEEFDAAADRAHNEELDKKLREEASMLAHEIYRHKREALADAAELRKVALSKLRKIKQATLGDVCRALTSADNMKRSALNMATEKIEVTGADNAPLAMPIAPVVMVFERDEDDDDRPKENPEPAGTSAQV